MCSIRCYDRSTNDTLGYCCVPAEWVVLIVLHIWHVGSVYSQNGIIWINGLWDRLIQSRVGTTLKWDHRVEKKSLYTSAVALDRSASRTKEDIVFKVTINVPIICLSYAFAGDSIGWLHDSCDCMHESSLEVSSGQASSYAALHAPAVPQPGWEAAIRTRPTKSATTNDNSIALLKLVVDGLANWK